MPGPSPMGPERRPPATPPQGHRHAGSSADALVSTPSPRREPLSPIAPPPSHRRPALGVLGPSSHRPAAVPNKPERFAFGLWGQAPAQTWGQPIWGAPADVSAMAPRPDARPAMHRRGSSMGSFEMGMELMFEDDWQNAPSSRPTSPASPILGAASHHARRSRSPRPSGAFMSFAPPQDTASRAVARPNSPRAPEGGGASSKKPMKKESYDDKPRRALSSQLAPLTKKH